MANNLKNETSPYLLEHRDNPVNWYPWGKEAFEKAEAENKPVFLSIGYSTCHWCHVMAKESFEDEEVADILNKYFISVKVDKEERPDIDSIYMNVCQIITDSGGWPMSVFVTPDKKPFYAGTYFPKDTFITVLEKINDLWHSAKDRLIESGDGIISVLNAAVEENSTQADEAEETALKSFEAVFDDMYGGFGYAPKFPTPHNLLFLMNLYEQKRDKKALFMAEKTLRQMYKGGLFDHIGFGFSRYSTDRYFLIPHFEKMLYDNALLIIAYIKAYDITKYELYKEVAVKTADYILREMTNESGGFYTAQDADSEGTEGKYYTFDYDEIINLLGTETGDSFCKYYDITREGNFEGKNVLNLLNNQQPDGSFDKYLQNVREYRKSRAKLKLDDKILTSWNSLMIAAFALMYRVLNDDIYLKAAEKACEFIEEKLCDGDSLYVSFRDEKALTKGFLDDYAFYIYALLNIYEASLQQKYLDRAILFYNSAADRFLDKENGGFYLYGKDNEQLIVKPKETYDDALPSGNSVMAWNLTKLWQITEDEKYKEAAQKQISFMSARVNNYPMGHSFFLLAQSLFLNPPMHITCTVKDRAEKIPLSASVKVARENDTRYPAVNGKTTYYVCKNNSCLPPVNNLWEVL
ncbi:MAG: thioredoxin domain-containing protein [Bacillota bacterium]|nr:thioredoxin domain-containing protein [Bacillota bacterium]